ncbi:hypothetical protein PFISCL1PPCAC_26990, partial [Pristionchus fissidentatus]
YSTWQPPNSLSSSSSFVALSLLPASSASASDYITLSTFRTSLLQLLTSVNAQLVVRSMFILPSRPSTSEPMDYCKIKCRKSSWLNHANQSDTDDSLDIYVYRSI